MDDTDLTDCLNRARAGDLVAGERAFALLYQALKGIAKRVAGAPDATLSATALVNEAYLKLLGGQERQPLADRAHFLRLAARAMRQIAVDNARDRQAQKRGGGWQAVDLTDSLGIDDDRTDVLAIDQALGKLEARDAQLARIVEGHFFAGLTFEELAAMLATSDRSVRRGWELARAFLLTELAEQAP